MALHILNTGPTTGEKFANSLATGLSALAEGKLQQLAERNKQTKTAKAYETSGLEGITPEIAQSLSRMEPEDRKLILKQLGETNFRNKFSNAMGIKAPTVAAPTQKNAEENLIGPQTQQTTEARNIVEQKNEQAVAQKSPETEAPTLESLTPQVKKLIEGGYPIPKNQKEATDLFKEAHKANIEEKKLAFKEKQFTAGEKSEAYKQTQETRKALSQGAKTAKDTIKDLNRFKELEDEGVDTAGYYEMLKRSGFDIPALMNPASEEFLKIQQGFLRGAKDVFGSRISNFEAEQFLKGIPSLSQSPEGRKRVIAGFEYLERAKLARFETAREIIAKNDGIPPLDLDEQIEESIDPKLDKLADKFKEDLKRKVPASQHKAITAAQALAGDVFGSLGEIAEGAIGGAALGSAIPVVGTGIGALIGAGGGVAKRYFGKKH